MRPAPRAPYCTVRLIGAEAIAAPLVPVTVMVPLPAAAVLATETVAVAFEPGIADVGLNVTVTPLGAVALSEIGFV